MTDVAANWQRVHERVSAAAQSAGRDPASVCIIAVAKTKPAAMVEAVLRAGAQHIGENYVQEATAKIAQVEAAATWHFIGHLQRNKAHKAAQVFQMVQTVDGLPLARALNRHASELGRRLRVLIEVNVGGEESKSGVAPVEVEPLLSAMAACTALQVDGLMTIPPPLSPPEVRRHFRMLRQLRDRLRASAPENARLDELSMGMTDDFEVAIEEGSTMVRIGRAIFGSRS